MGQRRKRQKVTVPLFPQANQPKVSLKQKLFGSAKRFFSGVSREMRPNFSPAGLKRNWKTRASVGIAILGLSLAGERHFRGSVPYWVGEKDRYSMRMGFTGHNYEWDAEPMIKEIH